MIARPRIVGGFTLLELLVATMLTLIVVMVATTVVYQMVRMTRRINGTIAMHSAAQMVHDQLARETAAMHPCAAVWLVSRTVDSSVELVFLRGKESPLDFPVNPEVGDPASVSKMGFTDLVWTRWHWSKTTGILSVAESRSARRFSLDNGNGTASRNFWQIPNNMQRLSADEPAGNGGMPTWSTFASVPQPRRETQVADDPATPGINESEPGPHHVLDQNRWRRGLGAAFQAYLAGDLGDHEDLLRNARPVLSGCTGFRLEVVDQAGVAHAADGLANGVWAAAGSFVDGGLRTGGVSPVDPESRPGLLRVRFTLGDSRTDATFTYSFSCSTPHPVVY